MVEPQLGIDGAILMERLPGSRLEFSKFNESFAYELGSLLAQIHNNRTLGYGDPLHPESLNSDPRIYFTMKFEEGLAECNEHLPATLLEQCRVYYAANLYLLDSVDGPCIVHRDFRQTNVMISKNKVQGIIDWSSARASFAEEDFCVLKHAGWWPNSLSKKSFLMGYASIRPVPDFEKIMLLLRLSRAIATIGFTVRTGTWNGNDAYIYQYNRNFLGRLFSKKPKF